MIVKPNIDKFLDALDSAVNSNTFWLSFNIADEDALEVSKFLIRQLRTGIFHFEMVKQDIERGWNTYSDWVLPKDWETPTFVQRPGNTWNGNLVITSEEKSEEEIIDLLTDLLTGQQHRFSRTGLGSPLTQEKAALVLYEFFEEVRKSDSQWSAYDIQPDFLHKVNDTIEKDNTILPYFEDYGRDLALGFKIADQFHVLLTNGYA